MNNELKRIARGLEKVSKRISTMKTLDKILFFNRDDIKKIYNFIPSKNRHVDKLMKEAQKSTGIYYCGLLRNTFSEWLSVDIREVEVITIGLFEMEDISYSLCVNYFIFDYDFKIQEDKTICFRFNTLKEAEKELKDRQRSYKSQKYTKTGLK